MHIRMHQCTKDYDSQLNDRFTIDIVHHLNEVANIVDLSSGDKEIVLRSSHKQKLTTIENGCKINRDKLLGPLPLFSGHVGNPLVKVHDSTRCGRDFTNGLPTVYIHWNNNGHHH
ncbi:hypothetical protein M8C21_013306 [Ambrosia artemisiifolia]|uniref:Uncharacterized protein n=1 Tax=Ambrosia artemisiifolia TaxID=4212 RepID=A0AAD5G194_AMBAR|nr:hypothetical protein M8C21_013306 [Ambrosia artemisiifolia]